MMYLMISILSFLGTNDGFAGQSKGQVGVYKQLLTFATPPEDQGELIYVVDVSFSFGDDFFALDRESCRIFRWAKDGSFLNTISQKGQGPGELSDPMLITSTDKLLYVYSWGGRVDIFKFDGTFVKQFPLKTKVLQTFRAFKNGSGFSILASSFSAPKGPFRWHLLDLNNHKMSHLGKLQTKPRRLIHTIASLNDPKIPLFMGSQRLSVAKANDGNIILANGTKQVQRFDMKTKTHVSETLDVPNNYPTESFRDAFLATPIAPQAISGNDLDAQYGMKLTVDMEEAMSPFTHLLIRKKDWLLFLDPAGSWQFCNMITAGVCMRYDLAQKKVVARGTLALPDGASLFLLNDRVIMTTFDAEDQIMIKEIDLGWLK